MKIKERIMAPNNLIKEDGKMENSGEIDAVGIAILVVLTTGLIGILVWIAVIFFK